MQMISMMFCITTLGKYKEDDKNMLSSPGSSSSPKNISSTSSLLQNRHSRGIFSPHTPMEECLHFRKNLVFGCSHISRSHGSEQSLEHFQCLQRQVHFSMHCKLQKRLRNWSRIILISITNRCTRLSTK